MVELVASKSDRMSGPGAKIGSSLPIRMPSSNFRSRFLQNGHRIWIQREKLMKIDYLDVFLGIQTP